LEKDKEETSGKLKGKERRGRGEWGGVVSDYGGGERNGGREEKFRGAREGRELALSDKGVHIMGI
jgi:hypothetical protein